MQVPANIDGVQQCVNEDNLNSAEQRGQKQDSDLQKVSEIQNSQSKNKNGIRMRRYDFENTTRATRSRCCDRSESITKISCNNDRMNCIIIPWRTCAARDTVITQSVC